MREGVEIALWMWGKLSPIAKVEAVLFELLSLFQNWDSTMSQRDSIPQRHKANASSRPWHWLLARTTRRAAEGAQVRIQLPVPA